MKNNYGQTFAGAQLQAPALIECLYSGTRLYKCESNSAEKLTCHIAPIPPAMGLGTRLRELDFFSFFRFTEGFFDGGAFLLPGRSFRDGGASVVEGGLLPDAIICSSSSRWYAWCNVNSSESSYEFNMCVR